MAKITKRKDGRYLINVYIGSVNGRAKYKSVYGKTPVEVRNKAALVRVEHNKGIDILSGDNSTFNFWADMWLKKIKMNTTNEWYKLLEQRTRLWISAFNNYPITKIKTVDCENVLFDLSKHNPNFHNKKPSDRTIKYYTNIITRIFDFCVQNQVLTFNPAKYITKPKGTKNSVREPITNDEIKYFLNTPHKLQTACLIMIYTGLRRGEIAALKWSDINLKNRLLTINKSFDFKSNKIKTPKTVSGNRIVPIPNTLYNHLSELNPNGNNLILSNEDNTVIREKRWNSLFNNYIKIICDKYNVKFNTSAHRLRHTYCTLLFEAGIDVLTAKKYMGHSDIQTTMKIYTHLRDCQEQKSIEKLNDYLDNI